MNKDQTKDMTSDFEQIRLSTSVGKTPNFCIHEYATIDPFSLSNRYLLLLTDRFQLHDGQTGQFLGRLSPALAPSSEPRWSRLDSNLLYYHDVDGNGLFEFDAIRNKSTLIRRFDQYRTIHSAGEADISNDGRFMVFCGDDRDIFVYDHLSDQVTGSVTWPDDFNSLYLTPNNDVLICQGPVNLDNQPQPQGVFMLKRDGLTLSHSGWVAPSIGHNDLGRDNDGHQVLVRTNAADPGNYLIPNCPNGIEVARLMYGSNTPRRCAWPVTYMPESRGGGPASAAVHISCPIDLPWCIVTIYYPMNTEPGAIYRLWFDRPNEPEFICYHQSVMIRDPNEGTIAYNPQPKTVVSADGSQLVYSTNLGRTDLGPTYAETVMVRLIKQKPVPVPVPPIIDPPVSIPEPEPVPVPTPAPDPGPVIRSFASLVSGSWSEATFTEADNGRAWIWHFEIVGGRMVSRLFEKSRGQ